MKNIRGRNTLDRSEHKGRLGPPPRYFALAGAGWNWMIAKRANRKNEATKGRSKRDMADSPLVTDCGPVELSYNPQGSLSASEGHKNTLGREQGSPYQHQRTSRRFRSGISEWIVFGGGEQRIGLVEVECHGIAQRTRETVAQR